MFSNNSRIKTGKVLLKNNINIKGSPTGTFIFLTRLKKKKTPNKLIIRNGDKALGINNN